MSEKKLPLSLSAVKIDVENIESGLVICIGCSNCNKQLLCQAPLATVFIEKLICSDCFENADDFI